MIPSPHLKYVNGLKCYHHKQEILLDPQFIILKICTCCSVTTAFAVVPHLKCHRPFLLFTGLRPRRHRRHRTRQPPPVRVNRQPEYYTVEKDKLHKFPEDKRSQEPIDKNINSGEMLSNLIPTFTGKTPQGQIQPIFVLCLERWWRYRFSAFLQELQQEIPGFV